MAGNLVLDGYLSAARAGFYGVTPPATQPAATAQSAVASTAISTFTTTTLTSGDVTVLNQIIARVEAIRVLQAQTRTDLIAMGIQKGSA